MVADAEVYKWTDADGHTHYGDMPPQGGAVKKMATRTRVNSAEASVEVNEPVMVYFPIYGTTRRELQESLRANGPYNLIAKQVVNAQTAWRITWKFDHIRAGGECRVGKFTLTVHNEMTFPQWMNPEAASESLRSLWESVAKDIRTHEDGHVALSVDGAHVLAHRIRALPPFATCEELNAEISREKKQVYDEVTTLNREYDRVEKLKIKPGGRLAP